MSLLNGVNMLNRLTKAIHFKNFRTTLMLTAAMAGTFGVNAAWAGANDYLSCNYSNICMWQDEDFVNARLFVGNSPSTKNFTGSVDFNDKASSWANRSIHYDARWYYDVNQAGDNRCMDSEKRLAWIGLADNEEASSSRIYASNTQCS
ncbi:MAG: hypothetical protein RIS75_521 [Actinomycetota bacterium]|jgi:pterin-4a-carbinolamine dehydratase